MASSLERPSAMRHSTWAPVQGPVRGRPGAPGLVVTVDPRGGARVSIANTMGDPPALPGRQQKFDISGGGPRLAESGRSMKLRGVPPGYTGVHTMLAIPPRCAVSCVIGDRTERGGIHLTHATENRRNLPAQTVWARGYFASAIGPDDEATRNYIRNQEQQANGRRS